MAGHLPCGPCGEAWAPGFTGPKPYPLPPRGRWLPERLQVGSFLLDAERSFVDETIGAVAVKSVVSGSLSRLRHCFVNHYLLSL